MCGRLNGESESDGMGCRWCEKIQVDVAADLGRELGVGVASQPWPAGTSVNAVCAVNTLSAWRGSFRSLRCE